MELDENFQEEDERFSFWNYINPLDVAERTIQNTYSIGVGHQIQRCLYDI